MIKSVSKTLKERILLWWRNKNHSQKSGGYQPQAAACLPRRVNLSTVKNSPHFDMRLLSIHDWAHDIFLCYSSWSLACTLHSIWCPPVSPLQGGLHPIRLTTGTGSQKLKSWVWRLLQTTDHPVIQSSLPRHTHSHCLLLGPPLSEESFCSVPLHTLILCWSQIFDPVLSSQTLEYYWFCQGYYSMQSWLRHICSQISATSVILSH